MTDTFFGTRTEATRDNWQTPIHIVSCVGKFDLDPAANVFNPTRLAAQGYTIDGLTKPWTGRVWLNPPYGAECRDWLQRLAEHGNGIALIPPVSVLSGSTGLYSKPAMPFCSLRAVSPFWMAT